MAMSAAQKNLFVKNRVHLISTITISAEFIGHLREGNHITDSMEDEIMVCAQMIVSKIRNISTCVVWTLNRK